MTKIGFSLNHRTTKRYRLIELDVRKYSGTSEICSYEFYAPLIDEHCLIKIRFAINAPFRTSRVVLEPREERICLFAGNRSERCLPSDICAVKHRFGFKFHSSKVCISGHMNVDETCFFNKAPLNEVCSLSR